MTLQPISAAKANRLFWLGRYTERAYISLHLLRRYHDRMIDGDPNVYQEYSQRLSNGIPYPDKESFRTGYMYDSQNPCSIISALTAANDNAIVLREEIMSETLSYIQLSLCLIDRARNQGEENITALQPVTDYLLAFWGSIDERLFDRRIRLLLRIGKLVENIDMHIRFDYPFYRINEAFESLKQCAEEEPQMVDHQALKQLDVLLNEESYEQRNDTYKATLLCDINRIAMV